MTATTSIPTSRSRRFAPGRSGPARCFAGYPLRDARSYPHDCAFVGALADARVRGVDRDVEGQPALLDAAQPAADRDLLALGRGGLVAHADVGPDRRLT